MINPVDKEVERFPSTVVSGRVFISVCQKVNFDLPPVQAWLELVGEG
jgi:hypothetical protein